MSTVNEVLEEIKAPEGTTNRFSKKSFNKLLKAIVNDTEFTSKVAVVKNKELKEVQEVMVTKEFRKFLKKVLEKAGIDKAESEMVMQDDFKIDNVDGLYDFMESAIYTYLDAGNKFEFQPREDFRGNIALKVKQPTTSIKDARNPQTNESLGTFEYKTGQYKALVASSPCPDYLKTRKRV